MGESHDMLSLLWKPKEEKFILSRHEKWGLVGGQEFPIQKKKFRVSKLCLKYITVRSALATH